MKPVLLLLHAASYTRAMWRPVQTLLADEFCTMAIDLPGHGTQAGETFTFAAARQAVADALEAFDGLAVLVGVSLGGCLAMDFAGRFPERVAGLVLSGCTFDPRLPLFQLVLTGEGFVFPRGAKYFTKNFHAWASKNLSTADADAIVSDGSFWDAAAEAVLAMRGVDFRAKLALFPGPTLILNGARDWVHRTSEASFARAAQNARVELVPHAGHVACLDAPVAFADAVKKFVSEGEK